MKTTTSKTSKTCKTSGCSRRRLDFGQLCQACYVKEMSEKAAQAAPGLEVKVWSPRPDGSLMRAYVKVNGEEAGYVESRSFGREPSGYYETHRAIKGESAASETITSTLTEAAEEMLLAAVIAVDGEPVGSQGREFLLSRAFKIASFCRG